jgi:hypothetical protein
MPDRGVLPGEGPTACPFVAFDDDRDRRSVEPDHRHRCYAEVRPAPRALAHQSAYCLTGSFPACPTFVDWARREAARAVPASVAAAPASPVSGSDARGPANGSAIDDDDGEGFIDDLPPRHPRRRDWASPPPWLGSDGSTDQLRAFDDDAGEGASAGAEPPLAAARPGPDRAGDPDLRAGDDGSGSEAAPAPAFLADRERGSEALTSGRGPAGGPGPTRFRGRSSGGDRPVRPDEDLSREPSGQARRQPPRDRRRPPVDRDAPSWEAPRRYEAYPTLRTRVGLPRIPPLGIALIAVLVAAALLFALPSIFGGAPGPASTGTPRPSATAAGSVAPTTPAAPTPQTYVVKAGDTLSGIADEFGLTVDQMMAANPQLEDPDSIRIDDVLTIPPPGSPGTSPSGSVSPAP